MPALEASGRRSSPAAGVRRTYARVGAMMGLAAILTTSGCAKRYALTPQELERVKTEAGVQPLRVYTNKKLIAIYDEANVQEQFQVQKKIRESADEARLKEVVTKNTAGLIIAIDELNGAPLLWVTFDPSCSNPDCAYGFVETEDKTYRLVTLPPREGYRDARAYRGLVWKRRRLNKGKLASLAEANEVYLAKKMSGKILTVDLQVKKVVDKRTRTRTRRSQGID